jgi:hypothetical protein
MKTKASVVILAALILMTGVAFPLWGAEIRISGQEGNTRGMVNVQTQAPSYGAPPQGYIYGGPYYPPYPYYSYPYSPYPWPPPSQGLYAPPPDESYGGQLIPAGRLVLLADPVSAEVSVDGLRLTQRSDLSYEVGLLVGKHNVSVKADGFEPYEKTVEIPGGQQVYLTIRLKSLK